MTRESLLWAIDKFAEARATVVGDLMLDRYMWGRATRISPESPVMVVEVDRETAVPGGAANVAANLLALGLGVSLVGVRGDDEAGAALMDGLRAAHLEADGVIVDPDRPTTVKTRVVAQSQQVVRFDREVREPIGASVAERIGESLVERSGRSSAVLVSDYAKGALTPDVVGRAIALAGQLGIPSLVNAKPASLGWIRGATVATVNQSEAHAFSGDPGFLAEEQIREAGDTLREAVGVRTLVVTRGPEGMMVWSEGVEPLQVEAHKVPVYDVAGAGDTVVSVLTAAFATGSDNETATWLAAAAAAVVVGKLGVATCSAEELRQSVETWFA
ncbi:MAG: bifunctional hydroxymethylpyrimidine kinase/phosphomethylpyrimidine kinase [Fimbriimonadaceae bacterium]|nr:bifunctional hydroxymethylpyrimidine kinase/phosphomethylpyrimidine kinase [Fimbriimonadaceae bacterium]QYK57363.1 MAG: bifunctional hydroxymethylpyrimidine kinase/phosphomethylpyrimidine kinase [Fimbriimonadaceae bacterium]